jgi:CheY-like chemotaxis protein
VKGSELILVVEDEEMVRNLTRSILEESGYRVLTAANGDEALELALRHGDSIHLMLADVILPGFSGPEIVDRARPLVKDLRVLFMSGYAEDLISHQELDTDRPHFLQKPFTPTELVAKVREILDGEARAIG